MTASFHDHGEADLRDQGRHGPQNPPTSRPLAASRPGARLGSGSATGRRRAWKARISDKDNAGWRGPACGTGSWPFEGFSPGSRSCSKQATSSSTSGTSLNFFITSCDSLWLEHRAQGHIREQRYLAWIGTTTCPLQPPFPCFRRVRAPSCCRALFLACQGQGSLQVPSIARSTEPSNVLLIDAALSRRRQVAGCPRVSAGMRTTQPGQMRPAHVLQAVREAEFRSAEVAIAPSLFLLLLYQCRKSASITDLSHRPGDTLWHRQLPAVLSANASTLAGVGRRH